MDWLIKELTQRKVPSALLIYAMSTWGVLQVVDVVGDPLSFPPWIQRALVIATILGFPVVLVLSWVFDLTRSGLKSSDEAGLDGRRHLGFVSLSIPIFCVLGLSVFTSLLWDHQLSVSQSSNEIQTIAVMELGGDYAKENSHLIRLPSELSGRLSGNPKIRLATSDAIDLLDKTLSLQEQAQWLGVRYLLGGDIAPSTDGVNLSMWLYDLKANKATWNVDFQNAQIYLVNELVVNELMAFLNLQDKGRSLHTTDAIAYELYLRGLEMLATSDDEQAAIKLFQNALAEDPRFSLPHASLCRHYVEQYHLILSIEAFEQGEKSCFRARSLDENSLSVNEAIGKLYAAYGQMDKARDAYQQALAINPQHFESKLGLARTYLSEDPNYVESLLNELKREQPGDPKIYRAMQNLYFSQGRYEDAIRPAQTHLRLEPNNEIAKLNLAGVLMLSGEFSQSKDLLITMLRNDSPRQGSIQNNLASAYFFEGMYEEATELYRIALKREPENAAFTRNLGDAVWHQEGRDAAVPIFEQVLELGQRHLQINEDDDLILSCIMVAHGSLGNRTQLDSTLQELLTLAESDPQIHYDAAVAYSRIGDVQISTYHAKKAETLGYPTALINADPDLYHIRLTVTARKNTNPDYQ